VAHVERLRRAAGHPGTRRRPVHPRTARLLTELVDRVPGDGARAWHGVDFAKAALRAGNAVVATGRNTDTVRTAVGDALELPDVVDTWGCDHYGDRMPPSLQLQQDRQAQRRLAILRHAEEVTGNVAQTCRYYGISRQIFYTWLRRYQDQGVAGLRDRSSAPHHVPHATRPEIVEKIVYLRRHYHFGPVKIQMYLKRYHDLGAQAGERDRGAESGDPCADDADLHGCPVTVLRSCGCPLRVAGAERGWVRA
jgi:transposase